jgi:KAP family P-loop domain
VSTDAFNVTPNIDADARNRYNGPVPGFISDHPTYADCLNRIELLKEVANQVKTCRPPQVIGIYGDWGSGKTSFLRALQLYLGGPLGTADEDRFRQTHNNTVTEIDRTSDWYEGEGIENLLALRRGDPGQPVEEGYQVVWFDAWRYQGEDAPIIALIHEIRRQFGVGSRAWEMLNKQTRIALESTLLALEPIAKAIALVEPVSGFFASAVGKIRKVADRVEKERYEVPLSSDEIRRHLNQAVKQITDTFIGANIDERYLKALNIKPDKYKPQTRLTIIIDDLDRCEPEMALRLLEGIKLFFNIENCVFVLGVNSRRLTDHVAKLYGADDGTDGGEETKKGANIRHAARDYLDKIINTHYWLGLVQEPTTVLERLMPDVTVSSIGQTVNLKGALITIVDNYKVLPPNPRKLKGFLATLGRYNGRSFGDDPVIPELLIVFAYLHHFYPEILRKLLIHPGYGPELQEWCRKGGAEGPPETKAFKSLVNKKNDPAAVAEETFPDPIYDQVLLIQPLLNKRGVELDPSKIDFKPYSLFG